MTATEPASLDALLANATPVETEPFNVRAAMAAYVNGYPADEDIARYLNSLRVDTDQARRIAVTLEQECADKDRRIKEALRWLEMAESYSIGEDCSAAIDDAMAALRGEES